MSGLVTIAAATAAGRAFIKAASATIADIDRVLETLTKQYDRARQRRERRQLALPGRLPSMPIDVLGHGVGPYEFRPEVGGC